MKHQERKMKDLFGKKVEISNEVEERLENTYEFYEAGRNQRRKDNIISQSGSCGYNRSAYDIHRRLRIHPF